MLLQVSDFVGFHAHVSTYQTSYLGEEREIEQVLEEESMEGYRKLRRLLGISESETSAL